MPLHLFKMSEGEVRRPWIGLKLVLQNAFLSPWNTICFWGMVFASTVDLNWSGLFGTASHSDVQKIRVIGFFSEKWLYWQIEVGGKNSTNGSFRLHFYLRTNKTLERNSFYVFDSCGEIWAIKGRSTITVQKCLPEGPSRSRQPASGYVEVL